MVAVQFAQDSNGGAWAAIAGFAVVGMALFVLLLVGYWKVFENNGRGFASTATTWMVPDSGGFKGFSPTRFSSGAQQWDLADVNGHNVQWIKGRLPCLRFVTPPGSLTHNERHLVYPPTDEELTGVFAVPDSYLDKTSTWYAWGDISFKAGILDELLALPPSANASQNDDGSQLAQIYKGGLLGNAL